MARARRRPRSSSRLAGACTEPGAATRGGGGVDANFAAFCFKARGGKGGGIDLGRTERGGGSDGAEAGGSGEISWTDGAGGGGSGATDADLGGSDGGGT